MATIILGDIVEVIKETVHNPQESGFQYFVGLEHYDSGEPLITRYATPDNLTSSVKHFAKGDILVARRNVYLKRASLVDFEGVTSGDSIVLRAKDKKYQQILPFILNSDDFWDYAEQNSDGTMSKRLSPADLLDYEFEEPENIELLADKLWAAYRVKESYKKLLAATDDMLKAKFQEMFGEGKWEQKTLGEVGNFQRGGGFQKNDYVEQGIPCIHYGQIHTKFGPYVNAHLTEIKSELAKKTKYAVKGDLIVAITSEDEEGSCKSTAWLGNYPVAVGGHAAIFHHSMDPLFMTFYFKSSAFNYEKVKYARGSKVVEIKPDDVAKIHVPVPPMELQQKFAIIATQAEATKESLRKSIENIDQVIKSLINQ